MTRRWSGRYGVPPAAARTSATAFSWRLRVWITCQRKPVAVGFEGGCTGGADIAVDAPDIDRPDPRTRFLRSASRSWSTQFTPHRRSYKERPAEDRGVLIPGTGRAAWEVWSSWLECPQCWMAAGLAAARESRRRKNERSSILAVWF